MTLEGLGEVLKGDSADTCAGKFPLVSMGGRGDRQACADGERGPPSARAEITLTILFTPSLSMALAKLLTSTCTGESAPGYEIIYGIDYVIGYVIDYAIGHINDKVKMLSFN